jgi:hypothetical protein
VISEAHFFLAVFAGNPSTANIRRERRAYFATCRRASAPLNRQLPTLQFARDNIDLNHRAGFAPDHRYTDQKRTAGIDAGVFPAGLWPAADTKKARRSPGFFNAVV